MNAKLREAILKAMCCGAECQYFGAGRSCRMHAQEEEERLYAVERVLSANGYQIVPVEPTEKMVEAVTWVSSGWVRGNRHAAGTYRAMLAAAKEDADGA